MNDVERLLRDLKAGHSALIVVPPHLDIHTAEEAMNEFGIENGMNLSIVPMMTETDQKLAIGPGTEIAQSSCG